MDRQDVWMSRHGQNETERWLGEVLIGLSRTHSQVDMNEYSNKYRLTEMDRCSGR